MIIGFTHKTGKILPRILCRNFRHCAVVLNEKRKMKNEKCFIFMNKTKNGIHIMKLSKRDLKILEKNGWVFIKTNLKSNNFSFFTFHFSFITCVGFAKRALGIRRPFILTPDQLYKYLTSN